MAKSSAYTLQNVFKLEQRNEALASASIFMMRISAMLLVASLLTCIVLLIGMVGFHHLAHLSWLQSFYNASMILSGMGIINLMTDETTKIFAGVYALSCGLIFSVIIGLIFVPIAHRIYHKFHFDGTN